jgi:hypothetical protein
VEGDVWKFASECGAIDCIADAVEPFVHFDGILAHMLADDIEWDLEVGEWTTGEVRQNGDDVIASQLVAPEVEALAREPTGVLEKANGYRADVR